jgi:hypothetical protein
MSSATNNHQDTIRLSLLQPRHGGSSQPGYEGEEAQQTANHGTSLADKNPTSPNPGEPSLHDSGNVPPLVENPDQVASHAGEPAENDASQQGVAPIPAGDGSNAGHDESPRGTPSLRGRLKANLQGA